MYFNVFNLDFITAEFEVQKNLNPEDEANPNYIAVSIGKLNATTTHCENNTLQTAFVKDYLRFVAYPWDPMYANITGEIANYRKNSTAWFASN